MNVLTLICLIFLIVDTTNVNSFENYRRKRSTRFKVSLPTVHHRRNNNNLSSNKVKSDQPIVKTEEGLLRGYKFQYRNKDIFLFSGVPYASKPERFQAPKPFPPWDGVRDATKEGSQCLQSLYGTSVGVGSEDCLFLEVSTLNLNKDKKGVLVWIHGGGYRYGSGSKGAFGPQRFVHQNLVVVSINYRLDVFGWLSTGTKHAPGNAGIRDSIEALRWVKRNIENFGGDPDNVCIHGISSSAIMIDALTLSPLAKGLFHKVIMGSGTTMNYWALNHNHIADAFEIGRNMGIKTANINKLGEILQTANASDLLLASKNQENSIVTFMLSIKGLVIEKSIPGIEPVLSESPEVTIASGKFNDVPTMYTMTDNEGRFLLTKLSLGGMKIKDTAYFDKIDDSFYAIMPDEFWPEKMTTVDRMMAARLAKKFYVQDRPIDNQTVFQAAELYGDVSFTYGVISSAIKRSQMTKKPIYISQLAYARPSRQQDSSFNIPGVGHAEDAFYYYVLPLFTSEKYLTPAELQVINRMVTLVANFVKYGNPTPKTSKLLPVIWKPFSKEDMYYLRINETLSLRKDIFKKRVEFYDKLI